MKEELNRLYAEYVNWCADKDHWTERDSVELFITWIITGDIKKLK